MGLIDKFKNMFTEEVEEEIEIETKNVINANNDVEIRNKRYVEPQVTKVTEIPTRTTNSRFSSMNLDENLDIPKKENIVVEKVEIPKQEDVRPTNIEEKKVLKREEKFVFPVYFDEKDFEKIEAKPKKVEEKKQPEKKEVYGTKIEKKEEPKVFKPTPIISPIYGVLDKNYHKEDISSKKIAHSEYRDPSKPLTIDEVRKKAYGTLEDDIETSLIAKSSIFMDSTSNAEEKEESENNLLTDLVANDDYSSVDEFLNSPIEEYKAKHGIIEDDYDLNETLDSLENSVNETIENIDTKENKTTSLDDLLLQNDYEENIIENYMMNNNSENEENNDEDLTQSDLFNLIDSMYEKGDE